MFEQVSRKTWTFQVSKEKLLRGALTQIDYREGRLKYWKDKQAEVIEQIRSHGVNVALGSLGAVGVSNQLQLSNVNGYDNAPRISLDPELQKNLSLCNQKIHEHSATLAQYKTWAEILRGEYGIDSLPTTFDDWVFFFGATGLRIEESDE